MKKETDLPVLQQPVSSEAKRSKNEAIETYLNRRYVFRFNTVKCKPEYKVIDNRMPFIPITRFALNSFKRELDKNTGLGTSADNIRAILESDFSPKVNPVQEYFKNLPRLNPETNGYIEVFAGTVEVTNPEKWLPYLTKWLVGVVANALNDVGCQNHLCLVLTGEQGKFKTTWLDHICPASLKSYLFTGKIDPQSKDVLTLIAEYLFINIDDQLNGNDFLTDPTGSRRFLPFEVVKIDLNTAQSINMNNVFSEVMYIFESGFRYWFDDAEIGELHQYSTGFHVQTTEYEMLIRGFEKPPDGATDCFMTCTDILNYLRGHCTLNLAEKRMGEALGKAGFERKSKRINGNPAYVWLVRKITPNPFISSYL